jgi:hypothetical protein
METYYFFKSIRRTIIQFLDMFNNISIERYDINGNVKGKYLVPLRYGPKSKAFLWLKDMARDEEMLPMLSVYMTGIDFDPQRITNKHQDILVSDGNTTTGTYAKNAMPYNIGFTLNIWVAHMVDIDQIYEQILPYFGPHAFIRVKIPELDIIYDVKVVLNGCSPVMTDDMGEDEGRILKWDTNFTVQTWLFKPYVTSKALIGSIDGSNGTIVNTTWTENTLYQEGKIVFYNGVFYKSLQTHTSSNETMPGTTGGELYWELTIGSIGDFDWTSGFGTSGFGDTGTSGKIVNRYYMDETVFENRDNPIKEIISDERPSETIAFRIVGLNEEETKIILDYERF